MAPSQAEPIGAREAASSDHDAIAALSGGELLAGYLAKPGGVTLLVAMRGQAVVAAGAIDPRGTPVSPDAAALFRVAPEPIDPDALAALSREAAAWAGRQGLPEIVVPVLVTEQALIAAMEREGFSPRGGAYRELGGGMVDYLHGYTGPEGYVADFARPVTPPPKST